MQANQQFLPNRIAALEAERDAWRREAETDSLTDRPNRRAMSRQTEDKDGFYVMADLTGFKTAQDNHPHGHMYGDRVLREFADFLRRNTRLRQDVVMARFGGDEFCVFTLSYRGALRMRSLISAWRSSDGAVGARSGLGESVSEADQAMYLNHTSSR